MTTTLSSDMISRYCQGVAQQVAIETVEETGSTNADLMARLGSLTGPTLRIASRQTAGRGRAGRTWHSAPGASLTFSLAWKFRRPVHALVGLPLAVGVGVADALAVFGVEVGLKWPNDVLYEGRKLAGVLIESASAGPAHDASWAVIGIGINLAVSPALAERIQRPVAEIPWLAELDQDVLMATLLNKLSEALDRFEADGFPVFSSRWNALHAYTGQTVVMLDNGRVVQEGVAVGVDDSGRFLLDTANGRVEVIAGDVSLRVAGGG